MVNLLGNLPLPCLDVLLIPKVQQGSTEYMGVNMDAVNMLLDFMEKRLDRVNWSNISSPARTIVCKSYVVALSVQFFKSSLILNNLNTKSKQAKMYRIWESRNWEKKLRIKEVRRGHEIKCILESGVIEL